MVSLIWWVCKKCQGIFFFLIMVRAVPMFQRALCLGLTVPRL